MNFRASKMSVLAIASMASLGCLCVAPAAASPTTVTFSFDNMGSGNTTGMYASSSQISSYMTSQLQTISKYASNTISVTGAMGEQGASSYTGDNNVVGPTESHTVRGTTTTRVYPLTLANTNGLVNPKDTSTWDGATNSWSNPPVLSDSNPDGYIKNCTGIDPGLGNGGKTGCGASSSDIFINFNGLKILSFSFDFEIFPDGTCPQLDGPGHTTSCGTNNANLPDLEIWSGDNGTGVNFGTFFGVVPGASPPVSCDANSASDSTYTKSGAEGSTSYSTETAPQLICHATYTVSDFTSGSITTLDFMDWPETIGIDNLTVNLPEARSIAIFALGLIGLGFIGWRNRTRWTRSEGASRA
jgi:hypothetical protein